MIWVILSICLVLVCLFALCAYLGRLAFRVPQKCRVDDLSPYKDPHVREQISGMIASVKSLPFEKVSVRSTDGLTLRGYYYHSADGAPVNICFHGWHGTPFRDFSGGAMLSIQNGFNTLLVSQRAHADSDGKYTTFGVKERMDCLQWVRFVREKCGENTPILLSGISMGASTVLMALDQKLPPNVRAVFADCPFASPREIIAHVCRRMKIPVLIGMPLVSAAARLFAGFRLTEADARKSVAASRIPVLIVHGDADHFVPPEMSAGIQAASPDHVHRVVFPGARHGFSYLTDPAAYAEIFLAFCREHFPEHFADK